MTNYKNLDAWKKGMQLVKEVYLVTKTYPKDELYGLTSQTRRAAVSVPANIAEGVGRNYKAETIQFLHVARASLYELETHLSIAAMVAIITKDILENITPLINETLRILNGLITYYENANLK